VTNFFSTPYLLASADSGRLWWGLRGEFFGSALLQPAPSVCVSLSAFFHYSTQRRVRYLCGARKNHMTKEYKDVLAAAEVVTGEMKWSSYPRGVHITRRSYSVRRTHDSRYARNDRGVWYAPFIGRFTTCDRRRRDDMQLSSSN